MSISLFDILGPITVGPSSSHTAGAVRLGLASRILLNEDVKKAKITFYGSFAETYKGHGTDKAIVGGLLGYSPSDNEVRHSLELAESRGVEIVFATANEARYHPNTAVIDLVGVNGAVLNLRGSSLGGGAVKINTVDGFTVNTPCNQDTLVIIHTDKAGILSAITTVLAWAGYNISNMSLNRTKRDGDVVTLIETDVPIADDTVDMLRKTKNVIQIIKIPKF